MSSLMKGDRKLALQKRVDPELYFQEVVRYYSMAKVQQEECNLGTIPHTAGTVKDPLMQHVELYDVVNIKYAGFKQVLIDMWYGLSEEHPYSHKLHSTRLPICERFDGATSVWGTAEWIYVWLIHAVTGSGINYARKPSGYHSTILPRLSGDTLADLRSCASTLLANPRIPAYTSVGYQFPAFPKKQRHFRRGGDRFIVDYAPRLASELAHWLETSPGLPLPMRAVRDFMVEWNQSEGLRAYRFQYAAAIGDMANYIPHLVDPHSQFFHGTNAVECVSYTTGGKRSLADLDNAMDRLADATGGRLFDLEDICCDFIRWVENYVRPGHDYDH